MSNLRNIKSLEALRAVLATGTTIEAANSLGTSQSSVSRAIANLEADAGEILFDREGVRLAPTDAARKLNDELDSLFETLGRIERKEWLNARVDRLRIAATPSLAHHFLASQIIQFQKLNPDVEVLLDTRAEKSIWDEMIEGRYDLCVSTIDLRHSGLRFHHLRDSEAVCIMPEGHPLEARDFIDVEAFREHPLVALTRRLDVRLRLDGLLQQAGITPSIPIEVSTAELACKLVRAGVGVSVVNPFPYLSQVRTGVSVRPFHPSIKYQTTFAVPDGAVVSEMVRKFIKFVSNNTRR